MAGQPASLTELECHPLTPERWADFERLFGPRGACAGCWCMWWRATRSEWDRQKGDGNREALKAIVHAGEVPGLLAYAGGQAIGWCAVQPREAYRALERSRILKRVDERPVWSVTCFFVARPFRRQGVTVGLLRAATEHARAHGARIVEGYPVAPRQSSMPDVYAFTGTVSAFRQAGFAEVLRRSESRPIMRYVIGEDS